jgi:biotin carboxyl carrier protein
MSPDKKIQAQYVKGQLWIHYQGRNFIYESEDKAKFAQTAGVGSKVGDILAPMPGKLTKIFKKEGDLVQKGDAILVMEAMKMEYTLKSEGEGILEKIECKVGDQVALGKCLARIKAKI